MAGDRWPLRVCLLVVALWVPQVAIFIADPARPVVPEFYPVLMLALGWLFGREVTRRKRDDEPPYDDAREVLRAWLDERDRN